MNIPAGSGYQSGLASVEASNHQNKAARSRVGTCFQEPGLITPTSNARDDQEPKRLVCSVHTRYITDDVIKESHVQVDCV
jgi:hypothetical protein